MGYANIQPLDLESMAELQDETPEVPNATTVIAMQEADAIVTAKENAVNPSTVNC